MKRIPLSVGRWKPISAATKSVLVDDADYPNLVSYRWYFAPQRCGPAYARRTIRQGGKTVPVSMHRVILGLTDSRIHVDHINGNGLDNRRCNLRVATHSQNAANSKGHRDRKSAYKGVCFEKRTGKWEVQLTVNRTRVFRARFDREFEAGQAYKYACKKHNKEFARYE